MQPLECLSNMNAVIVVGCFYTKFAVLRDSTPVVLSVNHFTYEMQGYCLALLVTRQLYIHTLYSCRVKKINSSNTPYYFTLYSLSVFSLAKSLQLILEIK